MLQCNLRTGKSLSLSTLVMQLITHNVDFYLSQFELCLFILCFNNILDRIWFEIKNYLDNSDQVETWSELDNGLKFKGFTWQI